MKAKSSLASGLTVARHFTNEGVNPLDLLTWVRRDAVIKEPNGHVVFQLDGVEVPEGWSQLATDIVVAKYVRKAGVPDSGHEVSVKQVIYRIAHSIRTHGEANGYFRSPADAMTFEDELTHLLVTQRAAFNSPVWFNCGLYHEYGIGGGNGNWRYDEQLGKAVVLEHAYEYPQCSACFIQWVDDDLMSIFGLVQKEARIFKYGSGTGTNFSKLRSRYEQLSGGGMSSGVMSFLKVLDAGAGATKSGGTTRRAAKMVILDADHPEILDFIRFKAREEQKAKMLIAAGLDPDFNGEAYGTVAGQNANNSVRVTDEFMKAVENDGEWQTTLRTTGDVHETLKARDLMREIAEATWACADPGMQFDTIINDWHTCANTDRIYASNPCSEFMFLDETACNLASLNLLRFMRDDGSFDLDGYLHTIRIFSIAMEILVGFSSYPSGPIAEMSWKFRPLGLGYANLGTLLMVNGIPYDSDEGRALAASFSAILCGEAYAVSAELAEAIGTFAEYKKNRTPMLRVIGKHREAASAIGEHKCYPELRKVAQEAWRRAEGKGKLFGYRNSQMTLLAPTGTIGLLMDCDTTGVEPDFALVKYKKFAGGGQVKIVNQSVEQALETLGYTSEQIENMLAYIDEHETVEGAPHLRNEHLAVFDCANACGPRGTRFIMPMAHVKIMAAVQPFMSGAISKTINVPAHTTVEEIEELYMESWRYGLKAVAIYRDGSKGSQPLNTADDSGSVPQAIEDGAAEQLLAQLKTYRHADLQRGVLEPNPQYAPAGYFHIQINNGDFGRVGVHIKVTEHPLGTPKQVFMSINHLHPPIRDACKDLGVALSQQLRAGVIPDRVFGYLVGQRGILSGMTDNPLIRNVLSLNDAVGKLLSWHYLKRDDFINPELLAKSTAVPRWKQVEIVLYALQFVANFQRATSVSQSAPHDADAETALLPVPVHQDNLDEQLSAMMGDAPVCDICGHLTVRNASCFRCLNCGNSIGCS